MELTEQSLSKLISRLHPAVVKVVKDIVYRQDVAEDLAMITWETMYKNKDRFADENKIKAFMFISAKNLAITWLKGERIRKNLLAWNLRTEHNIDIGDEILRSDIFGKCLRLISKKFNSRYVSIFLKTMHGESNTQIAKELGTTGSNVTSARNRMMNFLRQEIGAE